MDFLKKLFRIKEEPPTPVEAAFAKVSPVSCYFSEGEKAVIVLNNFDVPAIGELLAFEFLVYTVTRVYFPYSTAQTHVGKAERLLEEILGLSGDHELHMDEIAVMGAMMSEGNTLEDIRVAYKKIPA